MLNGIYKFTCLNKERFFHIDFWNRDITFAREKLKIPKFAKERFFSNHISIIKRNGSRRSYVLPNRHFFISDDHDFSFFFWIKPAYMNMCEDRKSTRLNS